jgi:hypothetical protein
MANKNKAKRSVTGVSKLEKLETKKSTGKLPEAKSFPDHGGGVTVEDLMRSADEKELDPAQKRSKVMPATVPAKKTMSQGIKKMLEKNKRTRRVKNDPRLKYFANDSRLAKTTRRKTPR